MAQMGTRGEIQAIFVATKDGERSKEKVIEGAAISEVTSISVAPNYQQVLDLALEDFVVKSIAWIDSQVKP